MLIILIFFDRLMNFIKKNAYLLIALVASSLISCSDAKPTKEAHTIITGSLTILVDESFAPIIEDQLAVFESTYENSRISLLNMPERQVVDYLMKDSAKVAVLSRTLSDEERKFFEAKKIIPKVTKFATDGIALIANIATTDSLMTVDDISRILKGDNPKGIVLVFDNPNSSTVRYLKEMTNVDTLSQDKVYALGSNEEVIQYVNENEGVIGVVGINWIAQPSREVAQYLAGVKVLGVKNQSGKPGDDAYYKPSQTNLALGKYALARDLYVINCQGVRGLGLGFSAFLAGERGQRIILKSGLLPDSIPPREINIVK